ncbi:MAG: RdgB/HAM1 family non-canonical purine NTP pyrophosphatase [Candidatus Omnitrophica bacterium]|nr:RdgB/HAM1 family non-canonical purine NTP pyrophosphatase [Candidatus Omnitrophota bacterium]
MKKIVIATTNKNKKEELKKLLTGLNVKVLQLSDLKIYLPTVIEDGKTFRQNAIKKALTYSRYIKEMVLADDSGLMVDALGGKPGVRSSRFSRVGAKDEENNAKLLKLMKNVPPKKRQATFISVAAVALNGILLGTALGQCKGTIGLQPEGMNGFGYDPLFTPGGYNRTFAQFKSSFKNKISHRAEALKKAKTIIQKYL